MYTYIYLIICIYKYDEVQKMMNMIVCICIVSSPEETHKLWFNYMYIQFVNSFVGAIKTISHKRALNILPAISYRYIIFTYFLCIQVMFIFICEYITVFYFFCFIYQQQYHIYLFLTNSFMLVYILYKHQDRSCKKSSPQGALMKYSFVKKS